MQNVDGVGELGYANDSERSGGVPNADFLIQRGLIQRGLIQRGLIQRGLIQRGRSELLLRLERQG